MNEPNKTRSKEPFALSQQLLQLSSRKALRESTDERDFPSQPYFRLFLLLKEDSLLLRNEAASL
jgi:hypothetical protein